MPEETGYGEISAPVFADYVRDITWQLAQTARDFEMPELERALGHACKAAVVERDRRQSDGHDHH